MWYVPAGRPIVCGALSRTWKVWSKAGVIPVATIRAVNAVSSATSSCSDLRTSLRRMSRPPVKKFTSDQSMVVPAVTVTSSSCCSV